MHRPGIWPIVLIAVMVAQRLAELAISSRHAKRVRAMGGVEYGAAHFPLIVAVHTLFYILLLIEITHHPVHPPAYWPLWGAVLVAAQVLRYSAMRALGVRWNVRVWVVPGMAPVRAGLYRRLRHPNYAAVVMEFVAAPLLLGAWRTAIVISLFNALVLSVRIRCEDDALQRAAVDSSR